VRGPGSGRAIIQKLILRVSVSSAFRKETGVVAADGPLTMIVAGHEAAAQQMYAWRIIL
jgi:hypothetical protein